MSAFGDMTFSDLLGAIAAKTPTPGGGVVASATGALSAALAQMVVSYSIGKKSLAPHEPYLRAAAMRLENARELLLGLAEEDAAAYGVVSELSRLPEDDPRRVRDLPEAIEASVQVPMSTVAACVDLLRQYRELAAITNRQLRSDLAIAAVLADSAARSSRWNVIVNLASLGDDAKRAQVSKHLSLMLNESNLMLGQVERACEQ